MASASAQHQRLGSYAFLSVEGVVLLAQVHVLLVAELDASSLEACRIIALECCGDSVLLLLRDLHAQLFSVSERPQYTIVSLTARSDDVAHTPPCCPRMAALLSLPVPTMLESTYAVCKRRQNDADSQPGFLTVSPVQRRCLRCTARHMKRCSTSSFVTEHTATSERS